MIAFDEAVARLEELSALLIEERELLEKSDVSGLESMMIRKESLLKSLFLPDPQTPSEATTHPLRDAGFTDDQRLKLEKHFEALMRDNTISAPLLRRRVCGPTRWGGLSPRAVPTQCTVSGGVYVVPPPVLGSLGRPERAVATQKI